VAARFVEKRVNGVHITPHNCKIQDKDDQFYLQFQMVICGLDSIEARRWINAQLVDMAVTYTPDSDIEDEEQMNEQSGFMPLIDGGTEGMYIIHRSRNVTNPVIGFKGQARVILPTMTSCIECQLDMHAPRITVPLCTLATIPRQPEHCVEWAHIIAWEDEKPFPKLDNDDPEHISWLYNKALTRAKEFNIPGVTYSLTQGVVKNIIPAIASTNAIIAASCCNEAFKMATGSNPHLAMPGGPQEENYTMYTGDADGGIYTYTFKHDRKEDCAVCGNTAKLLEVDPTWTLQDLIEALGVRADAQLKKPSIRAGEKTLYMQSPPSLEEATRPNLTKLLTDFVSTGDEIGVSDPAFSKVTFRFRLKFKD
jgi:ubiquitin-activating enzyme E1 C